MGKKKKQKTSEKDESAKSQTGQQQQRTTTPQQQPQATGTSGVQQQQQQQPQFSADKDFPSLSGPRSQPHRGDQPRDQQSKERSVTHEKGRGEGGQGGRDGGQGRAGDGGRGREEAGREREEGGQGRGDGGQGRGEGGRGRGDGGRGRGEGGRGRGDGGLGRGEGVRGRGDGELGRGRGEAGRGRGESRIQRGEGGRGRERTPYSPIESPNKRKEQSVEPSPRVMSPVSDISSKVSDVSLESEASLRDKREPKQQPKRTGGGDVAASRKLPEQSHKPSAAGDSNQLVPLYKLKRTLGTKGRGFRVQTNHLELNLGNLDVAVHYDVVIDPDRPKKLLHEVMEEFRKKYYPKVHPAFDGNKNLYSTKLLTKNVDEALSGEVTIKEDGRDKNYKVRINFAAYVDLSELKNFFKANSNILTPSMSAIQCIDIVLRQAPVKRFIRVGRSFFTPPRDNIIDLGDGMEMYHGFFQSAILGWKPFLNVDVSHKAFPKSQPVVQLIRELYGDERRAIDDVRPLEKFLKTLKIEYEIPGNTASKRVYRVNGVGAPAANLQFKLDDGQEITITNYFKNVKNYVLRYPHLPCLWVGARTREQKIFLPCELCTILSCQVVNSKMTENQTRNMIRYSATDTITRKQKIMGSINNANFNNSETIREFGFSVSNQFTEVQARILQPPQLEYMKDNNKIIINPAKGVWRVTNFLQAAQLNKWTILNLDSRTNPETLQNLKKMFMRTAKSLNIDCKEPEEPFENLVRYRGMKDLETYFKKKTDFNLIIVIIPDSGLAYGHVKRVAEINVGILTQCLKSSTAFKKLNMSTIQNILLKVNAKLNGINHTLHTRPRCMNRPCMLMGADVTHPAPDLQEPSVAAVIASHDPKAFKYNLCWRLQPSREEMITDMAAITREQLIYFFRATKAKPEHIIYIRDGVSDGQFEQVLNTEMKAIRSACTGLQTDYQPAITFIVVQKRHHTRFFPNRDDNIHDDRNINVPAGTCVDTMITHPKAQDFYLVSHASIQGVAKPTKYRVIWDDKNMNEDELEELMYYLCHMFTRCTRSVSYPAPTYYAHLAAARAKVYCESEQINLNRLGAAQANLTIKECIVKEMPMFFV